MTVISARSAATVAGRDGRRVTADDVLTVAESIVESEGVHALTMRRLSDELGVAVTSIYWHVGNRDAVLDGLVDRVIEGMTTITPTGDDPVERLASIARQLRRALLERPHLIALVHQRDRTPAIFLPSQQAVASELARLGVTGADAAKALRALQIHVVSSVLMDRAAGRAAGHGSVDPALWPADHADPELVAALAEPAEYEAVFEYGLGALLSGITEI